MTLPDLTFQLIGFRVLALFFLVAVQGSVVAWAAFLLGDRGPAYDGRRSVVPTVHTDVIGAVCLVLYGYGWSKPVAVDAGQFRMGPAGILVVILAGFVAVMLLAVLFRALIVPALTGLPDSAGLTAAAFLRAASTLSISFALLSLVPLPPLAAGMLLGAFGIRVPPQASWVPTALLFVAVATGVVRELLAPAEAVLAAMLFMR
jgi:hypothetical protein